MDNKNKCVINWLIIFASIISAYYLGNISRGFGIEKEIKEEILMRMTYAIQSGMVTVNHEKIQELKFLHAGGQKTWIKNDIEEVDTKVDTNGIEVKTENVSEDMNSNVSKNISENVSEDMNSNVMSDTNAIMKTPEEG